MKFQKTFSNLNVYPNIWILMYRCTQTYSRVGFQRPNAYTYRSMQTIIFVPIHIAAARGSPPPKKQCLGFSKTKNTHIHVGTHMNLHTHKHKQILKDIHKHLQTRWRPANKYGFQPKTNSYIQTHVRIRIRMYMCICMNIHTHLRLRAYKTL